MAAYLEHANMSVRNIDEAIRFLMVAFPEFRVRADCMNNGSRWVHIGTDRSYLALGELPEPGPRSGLGVFHLGWVVDSVAEIKGRLSAAGYREGFRPADHRFRKRLYFLDSDDLEWEFIEYLTHDPVLRNDYED